MALVGIGGGGGGKVQVTVEPCPPTEGGSGPVLVQIQNVDSAAMPRGTPAAGAPSGTGMVRAQADSPARASFGLVDADTAPGFAGPVSSMGQFVLADWTAIVGTPQLAPLGTYFLHPTMPGRLTLDAPVEPGQIRQVVGRTMSPTCLDLDPTDPILL